MIVNSLPRVRTVCELAHAEPQEIRACATGPYSLAHSSHTPFNLRVYSLEKQNALAVCDASHTAAHKEVRACASVRAIPSHTVSHTPYFLRVCECATCASPKGDGRRVAHATATSIPSGRPISHMVVVPFGREADQ